MQNIKTKLPYCNDLFIIFVKRCEVAPFKQNERKHSKTLKSLISI